METLATDTSAAEAPKLSDEIAESNPENLLSVNLNEEADKLDEAELGEADDISDEEEDEQDEAGRKVFSVGEFVWGKIKHHPWWPGQIYDISDASELALKHKPKDKGLYLVAYFGDGTFSWCSGAQLKSFEEGFEDLSKQTSLKSFVYAVEDALSVLGEVVAFEMMGNSVGMDGFVRPVAENAGVRKGVLVPKVGVESLSAAQFDAAGILASVRNVARTVSVKSELELAMLKSKLLAFYHAKGYRELPKYYFPVYIVGMEDINTAANNNLVDDSVSNDDSMTPLASSSDKAHALQEDKLYGRRRRKSLADIIREETDTDEQNGWEDKKTPVKKQGTRRRKRAGQTESEGKGGQSSVSKSKKKAKSSQETNTNKDTEVQSLGDAENLSTDDIDRPDNLELDVALRSKGKKRKAATADKKDRTPAKSRDKKMNKVSFSPVTSLKQVGFEPVLLDLHTDSRVGERMSKAAKLIIESPPIKKLSGSYDPTTQKRPTTTSLHEQSIDTKLGVLSSNYGTGEQNEEDDDGRPMSAIIFMTFSDGVSMPTKADLLIKYRQFGSLDEEETDVLPNSLCAQVVFTKKSEGEHAFDEMVKMNTGDTGVQYRIRYVPRVSKVHEVDGSATPKTSSGKMKGDTDSVSVSYLKQKFEIIISKLNDADGETLSNELKNELHRELTNLIEKLSGDM